MTPREEYEVTIRAPGLRHGTGLGPAILVIPDERALRRWGIAEACCFLLVVLAGPFVGDLVRLVASETASWAIAAGYAGLAGAWWYTRRRARAERPLLERAVERYESRLRHPLGLQLFRLIYLPASLLAFLWTLLVLLERAMFLPGSATAWLWFAGLHAAWLIGLAAELRQARVAREAPTALEIAARLYYLDWALPDAGHPDGHFSR